MNRLAASMLRNSAAASCLPVTAAQASAVSSSRTEVSSMKPATSGGCCSRTSQMKYSAIVWLRTSSARAIWAGSLVARSVSAAICSAATHPSLRPCKSASSPGATRTPKFSSRAPLSDSERYRSLLRSSHSSPDSRSRCSRTGGSTRPASTSCAVLAGQRSTRSVMVLAAARRRVEVVNNDHRPGRQPRGIVRDRGGHVGGHHAVHREQLSRIGTEPRRHSPRRLDEPRPETDRVRVGLIARKPGRHPAISRGRPA